MELDPACLDLRARYALLIGAIVPRPIALVSTVSPDGRRNLAPFSFFSGIGSDPLALLFCPVNAPDGSEKDTLRNAKPAAEGGAGEFVVCAVTEAIVRRVAAAAEPLTYGESEFERVGLTPTPSRVVRPARVEESPLALECRTRQVVRLNPGRAGGGNIVVGEIVHAFVREDMLDARGHIDPDRLQAVARMGGPLYSRTRERFELPMGLDALDRPEPFTH